MSRVLKYILTMYVFVALLAVILRLLLQFAMPQYMYSIYWMIPAFFAVVYTVAFIVFCKPGGRQDNWGADFMTFKAVKELLAIVALIILFLLKSTLFPDIEIKAVLLTYLIFYILILIPETILLIRGVKK